MRSLAQRTGGREFTGTNDVARAVAQALDDSAVNYVLTYSPSHNDWNGRFRKIEVRVKRPGVETRHRTGYFAFPPRNETVQNRQAALADAASVPLDAHSISIDLKVEQAGPGSVRVFGLLEGSRLLLESGSDGKETGAVDLLLSGQSADGTEVVRVTDTIRMGIEQDVYDRILKSGLPFYLEAKLAENVFQLRLVVRDVRSGRIGSLSIPVKALRL
jgi:hypothetical protein